MYFVCFFGTWIFFFCVLKYLWQFEKSFLYTRNLNFYHNKIQIPFPKNVCFILKFGKGDKTIDFCYSKKSDLFEAIFTINLGAVNGRAMAANLHSWRLFCWVSLLESANGEDLVESPIITAPREENGPFPQH